MEQFLTEFSHIFTSGLFEVGNTTISLAYLLKLIVIVSVTILLARFVKQLIRDRVLSRFGLDRGSSEAIASILTYALTILGFLVILQTAGIDISSLTVFAGALGIGFGIGLQEIASNFISGITLLLEQPIRVGDFIEVDGLKGTVDKISFRSTIVRTTDNVFVIVPNNRFIQQNVINWSYNDPKCRIQIPVSFPDDCDNVLVTEAIISATAREQRVLSNPLPQVWFKAYGDGTINFDLQVWIHEAPAMESIKSSLYFLIDDELRSRQIETAAPQQNLHIRYPDKLAGMFQLKEDSSDNNHRDHLQNNESSSSSLSIRTKPIPLRNLLRSVSYFEKFTDYELRRLIEIGYRQRLRTSEVLFKEGDSGDGFYIILSGAVEIYLEDKMNKQLAILKEGAFFGELSLLLGIPRTASVRATEDTMLFVISAEGFEQLLQEQLNVKDVIIEELNKHQEELEKRQKQLRELGLIETEEDDQNVSSWVKKRLNRLFSLT